MAKRRNESTKTELKFRVGERMTILFPYDPTDPAWTGKSSKDGANRHMWSIETKGDPEMKIYGGDGLLSVLSGANPKSWYQIHRRAEDEWTLSEWDRKTKIWVAIAEGGPEDDFDQPPPDDDGPPDEAPPDAADDADDGPPPKTRASKRSSGSATDTDATAMMVRLLAQCHVNSREIQRYLGQKHGVEDFDPNAAASTLFIQLSRGTPKIGPIDVTITMVEEDDDSLPSEGDDAADEDVPPPSEEETPDPDKPNSRQIKFMTTAKEWKEAIIRATGEDVLYYQILSNYGLEKSNQLPPEPEAQETARRIVADWHTALQAVTDVQGEKQ